MWQRRLIFDGDRRNGPRRAPIPTDSIIWMSERGEALNSISLHFSSHWSSGQTVSFANLILLSNKQRLSSIFR